MNRPRLISAAALVWLMAATTVAHGGTRAWVSGHGTDAAGCGAPTSPCRSLQYAHDHIVTAGGEIDVLDPAGYGAITITKSISIINDGVGTAGLQAASGNVITINAPGAAVRLRGLDIEGLGAAIYGVDLVSGARLLVENSSFNGLVFSAIQFSPTGPGLLVVSNATMTNCGAVAINVDPLVTSGSGVVQATIERLLATDDTQAAVFVDGRQSVAGIQVVATVADSVMSDNSVGAHSVSATGKAPTFSLVRNSTITDSSFGVEVEENSTMDVSRSTIDGNASPFSRLSNGVLQSFGDNAVDGNLSAGATPTAVVPR